MSLAALLRAAEPDSAAVLIAAEKALEVNPKDATATHAKAVALLHIDRFDDANAFFKSQSALRHAAPLENAYALYKTGHLEEARKAAERIAGPGGRHLLAQVCYRLEDFNAAAALYRELWQHRSENEESDLRINSGATDAQLLWQGTTTIVKRPASEDLERFETVYNAACGYLARGELVQGEMLLKRANDLCLAAEDLDEDEKKTELLPIKVQQLYAFAAKGKTEAAEQLARELTTNDISDLVTQQIAQINHLALQGQPKNPYLAQCTFQSLPEIPSADKLFSVQEQLVKQNASALDLLCFKFPGVLRKTRQQLQQFTTPTADRGPNVLSALHAAARAQGQLGNLGLKAILPLLEQRPLDVGLALTVVQLYMLTKNHGAAIAVMQGLLQRLEKADALEVRYAPGIVAVLVALYNVEGRKAHVRHELATAATFWRRRSKTLPTFFQATGASLLRSGADADLQAAQELFSALYEEYPDDPAAAAGYVASFAMTNPSKFEVPASKLTAIDRLSSGVDAAALDQAGVPSLRPSAAAAAQPASRKRAAADATPKAKKRVRKSRQPKDMDGDRKPDPERWLALRDRSTYKPRGKKGKAKQAALTQGGISKEGEGSGEAKLDGSKPGGGGSGGGGGKSKKKGKKK